MCKKIILIVGLLVIISLSGCVKDEVWMICTNSTFNDYDLMAGTYVHIVAQSCCPEGYTPNENMYNKGDCYWQYLERYSISEEEANKPDPIFLAVLDLCSGCALNYSGNLSKWSLDIREESLYQTCVKSYGYVWVGHPPINTSLTEFDIRNSECPTNIFTPKVKVTPIVTNIKFKASACLGCYLNDSGCFNSTGINIPCPEDLPLCAMAWQWMDYTDCVEYSYFDCSFKEELCPRPSPLTRGANYTGNITWGRVRYYNITTKAIVEVR